jgi:hypothetical protein
MSALIPLRLLLALHIVTGLTVDALCAEYEILVVTPAINNEAILPGSPLPSVCRPSTVMKVLACRGEYEPASFVVKTEGTLRRVRVDVGPLTGPSGSLEADVVDVRVVQLLFRRVTDWPALAPALLLHDADLIVVDEKPQPHDKASITDMQCAAVDRQLQRGGRACRHTVDLRHRSGQRR